MRHARSIFSRIRISAQRSARLHNAEVYDRSIDVQILRLRRKIETNPSQPAYIKTERGAGYVFDTSVEVLR
jgi:two-component system, OmpR family, response regulator